MNDVHKKVMLFLLINYFWLNKERMKIIDIYLVVYQMFKESNEDTSETMTRKGKSKVSRKKRKKL